MNRPSVVVDASDRIRAQHRKQSRRRWLPIAVVALVVALVGGGVWLVWFSSWLTARSVEVTGNVNVSSEEVVGAAGVELGTPLARLDTAAIRQRVMELPVVADARVSGQLTGVVLIALTERTPVYALPKAGAYRLVDAGGTDYLDTGALPDGLVVVSIDAPAMIVGQDGELTEDTKQKLASYERLLADAAVVVQALPQSVRDQMVGLRATTADNFTVNLANGAQILWGSAEQSALKAEVIDPLLKVQATYYDVSSPNHPATRG